MDHNETGCHAPEGPILCINNCGFFGSAATMNMCSKCHKDHVMKEEQAKLAASSFDSIVNGNSAKDPALPSNAANVEIGSVELKTSPAAASVSNGDGQPKAEQGPSRCYACQKRVGLTGFGCKCGSTFCATHRYSDKHECPFDYRTAARDAIAKANPVVKAEKLEKI